MFRYDGCVQSLEPTDEFLTAAKALGFDLSPRQLQQLGRYLHLLLDTNKQFNLTGIKDPGEAWMRHVLDSLSVLPFLGEPGEAESVIDVGSGGGLPGIVVAIMRPDLRVTLLEATGKKARFLGTVAADQGMTHVRVVTDRAETAGRMGDLREKFDIAIARAVGPMRVMLELTMPMVRVGGAVLAMKGRSVEGELRDAGDALQLLGGGEVHVYDALPGVEADAVMVWVGKASATPSEYPRRPGVPKQEPL